MQLLYLMFVYTGRFTLKEEKKKERKNLFTINRKIVGKNFIGKV